MLTVAVEPDNHCGSEDARVAQPSPHRAADSETLRQTQPMHAESGKNLASVVVGGVIDYQDGRFRTTAPKLVDHTRQIQCLVTRRDEDEEVHGTPLRSGELTACCVTGVAPVRRAFAPSTRSAPAPTPRPEAGGWARR